MPRATKSTSKSATKKPSTRKPKAPSPEPVLHPPQIVAVAEREGVGPLGRYKLSVSVAGVEVNGRHMPTQLAADVVANLVEFALKRAPKQ